MTILNSNHFSVENRAATLSLIIAEINIYGFALAAAGNAPNSAFYTFCDGKGYLLSASAALSGDKAFPGWRLTLTRKNGILSFTDVRQLTHPNTTDINEFKKGQSYKFPYHDPLDDPLRNTDTAVEYQLKTKYGSWRVTDDDEWVFEGIVF